jgi:uncharacterized protein
MLLKFIYATDLHGNCFKYNKILQFAIDNDIKLIHLGADILPKNYDLIYYQKEFTNNFLKKFYKKCHKNNINVLASFGNDDIYIFKDDFKKYAELADEKIFNYADYNFLSYNFVPDYPFGLKTACKLNNHDNSKICNCLEPVDIIYDENCIKIININNIKEYFNNKTTIEEDLNNIYCDNNYICAFHCPPAFVDLDVCYNNQRVGSEAIYNWIKKNQPKISLHGHIHESYDITNVWKTNIDNTLVIQPGQMKRTRLVLIELKEKEIICDLIEID